MGLKLEELLKPVAEANLHLSNGRPRLDIPKQLNDYERANLALDVEKGLQKSAKVNSPVNVREQMGRRNLNNYQRSVMGLKLEELLKPVARENISKAVTASNILRANPTLANLPKVDNPIDTRHEVATIARVSDRLRQQSSKKGGRQPQG
jgi:hypothetical protein